MLLTGGISPGQRQTRYTGFGQTESFRRFISPLVPSFGALERLARQGAPFQDKHGYGYSSADPNLDLIPSRPPGLPLLDPSV